MIEIKRRNIDDPDFSSLVKQLDQYLKMIDGEDNEFYTRFNSTLDLSYVLVAYDDAIPVGCGALKNHSMDSIEIKRMYVPQNFRKKGIASLILHELEKWSAELGFIRCVLETGKQQNEAVNLYKKHNYNIIENYGPYKGVSNSICFEKK